MVLSPWKAGGEGGGGVDKECICFPAMGLSGLSAAAGSNVWLCKS